MHAGDSPQSEHRLTVGYLPIVQADRIPWAGFRAPYADHFITTPGGTWSEILLGDNPEHRHTHPGLPRRNVVLRTP